MKVALLNAPYAETYGPLKSASGRYFPLGLGYIAAVLRRAGHETILLDPEAQGLPDAAVAARLAEFAPQLVGVSCATPSFPQARHFAQIAKRVAPGCATVVGGVHATAMPGTVLGQAPEFDIAAVGEGEETMVDLAAALEAGPLSADVLRPMKGVAFRDGAGVTANAKREWMRDLDALPFPARNLVDFDVYVPHAHNRRGRRATTAITSRGCPYQCIFCASHIVLGYPFRSHSPEYIVDEIEYLNKTWGVDQIVFNDDVFTMDKRRDYRICELILQRNLKVSWFCFARVDSVNLDILKMMKRAGCFSVGFGCESGDPDMLKTIKKKITVEQIRQALAWANEAGIKSQCFFVFGNPGETSVTIERSINLAVDIKPALAFFNMMVPYPGTEAYDIHYGGQGVPMEGVRWEDWVAVGPRSTIQVPGVPSLERAVAEANRRFYLRPRQILKMLRYVTNLTEVWQLARGGFALSMQILRWRLHAWFQPKPAVPAPAQGL